MAREPKEHLPAVKLDLTVSANDVVAIKVSEFETALLTELGALKSEGKRLEAEASAIKAKVKAECQKVAEAKYGKLFEDTKKAFAALTTKKMESTLVGELYDDRYDSDRRVRKVSVRMSVCTEHCRDEALTLRAERSEYLPVPPAVNALLGEEQANRDAQARNRDEIHRNRADMDKIPALERAVRAAIAKEKLKDLGDEDLQKLIHGVNLPGMKALPHVITKK